MVPAFRWTLFSANFGQMWAILCDCGRFWAILGQGCSHPNTHFPLSSCLVSVSWDGRLFDCDFNQQLSMSIPKKGEGSGGGVAGTSLRVTRNAEGPQVIGREREREREKEREKEREREREGERESERERVLIGLIYLHAARSAPLYFKQLMASV